jgi:hypothetical protein
MRNSTRTRGKRIAAALLPILITVLVAGPVKLSAVESNVCQEALHDCMIDAFFATIIAFLGGPDKAFAVGVAYVTFCNTGYNFCTKYVL